MLSSSTSSVRSGGGGDNNNNNVCVDSDSEEPQWVRHCVARCQATSEHHHHNQQPPTPSRLPTTSPDSWRLGDSIAQTLLACLAGASPYPRLADAARCALLACEQRDAACAHREAEVCALEASLAEAKAAGDQLQCRLGQIEASWCAASRAADLADMALETSGVLVHVRQSDFTERFISSSV